jgi:hypothetical protein
MDDLRSRVTSAARAGDVCSQLTGEVRINGTNAAPIHDVGSSAWDVGPDVGP